MIHVLYAFFAVSVCVFFFFFFGFGLFQCFIFLVIAMIVDFIC